MKTFLIKYNQNKATITSEQIQLGISETQLARLAGFYTFIIKTVEVNPLVSVHNNSRKLLIVIAQLIDFIFKSAA
jgi:hypothetical protein